MSRKHFIAAAEQVKAMADRQAAGLVAENFAELFARFNFNFDRARFMAACGL